MDKESLKISIRNFADNFSFNITLILIFSIFLNITVESLILGFGVIINLILSKLLQYFASNPLLEKYFCSSLSTSNASNSIQLLGFLTSYYSVYKYIVNGSTGWMSSFIFMLFATIMLGRIYLENASSIIQLICYWSFGLVIGFMIGIISGNVKLKKNKTTEIIETTEDKTCNGENNQDYVCQAFKDGKVFESL